MIQLALRLLFWTTAKRLVKIVLAKNPQDPGGSTGRLGPNGGTALPRENCSEFLDPLRLQDRTSKYMPRKSFHFQGSVNSPIILRRLSWYNFNILTMIADVLWTKGQAAIFRRQSRI